MTTTLQQTAQAVLDRWDNPSWAWGQSTGDLMHALRLAIEAQPLPPVDDVEVQRIALANGFKLKEQPGGLMALNPYVFDFARALLNSAAAQPVPPYPVKPISKYGDPEMQALILQKLSQPVPPADIGGEVTDDEIEAQFLKCGGKWNSDAHKTLLLWVKESENLAQSEQPATITWNADGVRTVNGIPDYAAQPVPPAMNLVQLTAEEQSIAHDSVWEDAEAAHKTNAQPVHHDSQKVSVMLASGIGGFFDRQKYPDFGGKS